MMLIDTEPVAHGDHLRYHLGYLKLVVRCPDHGYHDVGDSGGQWFQRFTIQLSVN